MKCRKKDGSFNLEIKKLYLDFLTSDVLQVVKEQTNATIYHFCCLQLADLIKAFSTVGWTSFPPPTAARAFTSTLKKKNEKKEVKLLDFKESN